jgi:GMP synthase-like glutamine amidotransferase
MAGRILVLQHASVSGLGAYGDALDARGDRTVRIRCHEGDQVPGDPAGFDGVVSLGAPWSVYDGGPAWVGDEIRLLRRSVDAGVPVFGICFGAQLLAAALGARVWRGSAPEVGIAPLALSPAARLDPVFGGLPASVPMLHWHGDSFDLPAGAVLLASTERYRNQAFRAGRLAYGVQFHAEPTLDLVRGWTELPETRAQLEAALGEGGADRVRAEAEEALESVNDVGRRLMAAWRRAAEEGS